MRTLRTALTLVGLMAWTACANLDDPAVGGDDPAATTDEAVPPEPATAQVVIVGGPTILNYCASKPPALPCHEWVNYSAGHVCFDLVQPAGTPCTLDPTCNPPDGVCDGEGTCGTDWEKWHQCFLNH